MKRPLASACLTFTAALIVFTRIPTRTCIYCGALLLVLLGAAYWFVRIRARAAVLCALCSLFAAAFCGWSACSLRDAQCELLSDSSHNAELVVLEINDSYETPLVTARVKSVSGRKVLGVTTSFFSPDGLAAGDKITAQYEFDRIFYPSRSGELETSGELVAIRSRDGSDAPIRLIDGIRSFMKKSVLETVSEPLSGGLCAAVITGDRSSVPVELRDAMNRAGDSHLLAVSGLHITLLLGTLLKALSLARPKPALGLSVAVLLAAACAVFYGGTPSVVRASIMGLFSFVGPLCSRRNDPITSMSAAAAAIVLTQPLSVCDPSFLLSFSCCFAIVAVFPSVDKAVVKASDGKPAWLAPIFAAVRALALSATISIVTLPVIIALEFPLSLVAPLVNVSVIALTPFMLGASFLIPLFSLARFLEPLRMLCGIVAGLAAKGTVAISAFAASLPYAAVSTDAVWLKIWAVFACLVCAASYFMRNNKRLRGRKTIAAALCALTLAGGVAVSAISTAGVPRVFTYGGTAVVEGESGSVVIVDNISLNGTVYLKGYLKQRNAKEVVAVAVVDYLSDEKTAWLGEALSCDNIHRFDGWDSEEMTFSPGGVIITVKEGGEAEVLASDGVTLTLGEPSGAFDNGFRVSAVGADGEETLLCDGGAEYHSADITVYFCGENGYKRVRE